MRFLRGWLPPMQFIPDHRADEAEDVSNHSGDHNEDDRSHQIEWFNEVNRLDHVRPENEIDDRLRPADTDKKQPNEMPTARSARR